MNGTSRVSQRAEGLKLEPHGFIPTPQISEGIFFCVVARIKLAEDRSWELAVDSIRVRNVVSEPALGR